MLAKKKWTRSLTVALLLFSLSYAHTMEFLEIAHVEMYCAGEVVIEGCRRPDVLCVFWEGTCVERDDREENGKKDEEDSDDDAPQSTIWHAGDWTGPVSLQPDTSRCSQPSGAKGNDIIAISEEGVKVCLMGSFPSRFSTPPILTWPFPFPRLLL